MPSDPLDPDSNGHQDWQVQHEEYLYREMVEIWEEIRDLMRDIRRGCEADPDSLGPAE